MQDFKTASGYCQHLLHNLQDSPDQNGQNQIMTLWRQKYANYLTYTNLLFFESGRLVIFCHSPAVASRLRLEQNTIKTYLSGHIPSLSSIEIKVSPQNRPAQRLIRRKTTLSNTSAENIENTANCVTYKPLKQALLKLAKRNQKQVEKADKNTNLDTEK